jgi:hypothetical protein
MCSQALLQRYKLHNAQQQLWGQRAHGALGSGTSTSLMFKIMFNIMFTIAPN